MMPTVKEEVINLPAAFNNNLPTPHELLVYDTIAKSAHDSKLFRNIGDESGLKMIMLAARELSIPPMLALTSGIRNINGNLEISARMMNALLRRAGISIKILESNDNVCKLYGKRKEGDEATVSFEFAEAQRAGLVKPGGGWTKCPKDMCFARAISRLARQLAPDVIGGCYVQGEIEEANVTVIKADPVLDPQVNENLKADFQNLIQESGHSPYIGEVYLTTVMGHFGWTEERAMQELLKDKEKAIEKIKTWMSKKEKK